jgi:putative tryptophan/tyrosine transport system substrate-binding protein
MQFEASVTAKWLVMLKEIAPRLERAAFVTNPKTAPFYNYYLSAAEALSPSNAMMASSSAPLRWSISGTISRP